MGSCSSQNIKVEQQATSITLDADVRYGKLNNGFTYYLRKNNVPENTIELELIVKAGRIHEDANQLEYAHLLEHVVAGKTRNFPSIHDNFSKSGGYSNAQTGSRHTAYYATIPSHNKQVVKEGLLVLRDWAQGNKWEPEFIAMQRAAIQGEARTSDPYRNWIHNTIEREVVKNTAYKFYGNEERMANLQNFKPKAFDRFYKDWYRPDLEAAIIVGDINLDSVEYEIKRLFSDLKSSKNPKNAKERVLAQSINLDGQNQFSTVVDSTRQELKLYVIRTRPNFELHPKTKEDYQKMLCQQLYTIMLDTKARQLEQQYDPPFSNFSSNYGSNQFAEGQLNASLINMKFKTDNLQLLKNRFQRGLVGWRKMHLGFNQEDLAEAKEQLHKNYIDYKLLTSTWLIRKFELNFIYDKAAPHPEVESKLVSDILAGIDLKKLQDYFQEYGDLNKNTNYIFFIGADLNIPDFEVFKQWIKETDTMTIEPLSKENEIRTLANVVDIPIINKMEEVEVTENEIGVSTIELPNGAKVVLKPTIPRKSYFGNSVSIQAFRANEVPINNRQEYLAAKVAPEVLQHAGAGPYTKFELERFKREKGIKLQFRTNKDNQMIYATSKIEVLPELFNLLYLYLDQPRIDQKGFDAWKSDQEEQLEGKGLRGSESFIMKKIISKWYPQIPVLEMEDLHNLTMEEVFQATKKCLSSIENYTFIVTGDFDNNKLIPFLVNTLSAFPARNENPSAIKTNFDFPLQKMVENLEYKNINQVYTRLFFPVNVPNDIKTQIELQLLSKALNQRIYNRLRNGSYSPSARGEWMDIQNGIYAFRVEFDSALGNEDTMLRYAMEEFRYLRDNGVEKIWLESAIANELKSYEGRFGSFGYFNFWPDYLQSKLENNEDLVPGILNYGTLLSHFISFKDINIAVKKYMKEEHLQQFLGYPEGYREIK